MAKFRRGIEIDEPQEDQLKAAEEQLPEPIQERVASAETPASPTPPPRGRQSAAPFCPYHVDVRCKSNNSSPYFTRYYCPVDGCTYSQKVARPGIERRIQEAEEQEGFGAR